MWQLLPIWFNHSHPIASSYCAFCSNSSKFTSGYPHLGLLAKWISYIMSYTVALNSLSRLVYTAQSFHIKQKVFCCHLTSRLRDNGHSLNVFGSSLETVRNQIFSDQNSQKKRREPESGMAHFPCWISTRAACTSRRSTNSDGLVFPLFVLWVCAYDFEKFCEVSSSKSRCVASRGQIKAQEPLY